MIEGGLRRAVAEIRFGEDRAGLTKVGGRSIHQYWSLLSPHFRDVLLAPQRRSDDGGVAWNWRESADRKPPTVSELASVRKRLERANESFAENPVSPLLGDARNGTSSQALIDQVASKVKALADSLAAKSDAALADFVCRTETGVMIHSWGVVSPAQVIYPDSLETGIGGVVVAGGKPAEGYEVVIENAQGLSVARMQSDETGEFHFSKLGPGRYRVRVVSGRSKFSAKGKMVTVERGTVTRLELRSTSDVKEQNSVEESADATAETSPGALASTSPQSDGGFKWVGKTVIALLVLLLFAGVGVWAWWTLSGSNETSKDVTLRRSSMAPESFAGGENQTNSSKTSNRSASDTNGLGASVDGFGQVAHRAVLRPTKLPGEGSTEVPTGTNHLSSTIGSKMEVLSGVTSAPVSGGADVTNSTEQPAGPDDVVAGQESSADRALIAPSPESARKTTDLSQTRPQSALSGALMSGTVSKGGGAQAGEPEVISTGETKLSPGGNAESMKLPGAKKAALRQAQGVVSTGEAPTGGAQKDAGVITPRTVAEAARPEDMIVKNSDGDSPPDKGPTSKVTVVNKGLVEGKPHNPSVGATSEAEVGGVGQNPAVPDSAKSKRAKSATVDATKASARGSSAPVGSGNGPSPERADPAAPATENKQDQASGSANAEPGKSGETASESSSSTVADEASPADATGQSSRATQGKTKSAIARNSASRGQNALPGKPTTDKTNSTPVAPSADFSTDDSRLDSSGEHPQANKPAPAFPVGSKTLTVAMRMTGWATRLVRDTIVPTLPVRVGEDDSVEPMRERFVREQKARMPDTFRHLSIMSGFVFEFPAAPDGGAYYWEDSPDFGMMKRTVSKNQEEVSWSGETLPREGSSVLVSGNGLEIVRLSVDQEGNVALKVLEGVRCSLWLSVLPAKTDESVSAPGERASRFGWLVNRVAFGTASRPGKPAPEPRDLRIAIPLELPKGLRIEAALSDRTSGWALVTKIQIQPVP